MYKYNDIACISTNNDIITRLYHNKSLLRTIITEKLAKTNHETPFYKVLHHPLRDEWIDSYIPLSQEIRSNFDNVLIVGMGGSSLNAQSVIHLLGKKINGPKIHFLNNTDPLYFQSVFNNLDLHKTICIVISNSGETLETIYLTNACVLQYKQFGIKNYNNHFLFIVSNDQNQLRTFAKKLKSNVYDHENNISGRYSGFTNVSTLPALIAGINVSDIFDGVDAVIHDFWTLKEESIAARAACMLAACDKSIMVNMGYLQCFDAFLQWYAQIIAESLAKNGLGSTPVTSLGPNDQHSLAQLYLDGPQDKIFTIIYASNATNDNTLSELLHINDACFHATVNALQEKQLPVRTLILDCLTEKSVGALVAHSIIEIILFASILDVNPFNQPGVELIKHNSKKILNKLR